ARNIDRFIRDRNWHRRGSGGNIEDTIAMRIIDRAVVGERAVHPTRGYHGKLALEIDECFEHSFHVADRLPRRLRIIAPLDQNLPLAVVPETPRLEPPRTAQAFQAMQ